MTQNVHNAVIHLGHQNGTVTLWTPNLPHPAVRLLAHLGPVCSVSVDPSSGGRYMATAGMDGSVKLWDCRSWKEALRSWSSRGGNATVTWSQRGHLAVASGGAVNVHAILGCLITSLTFCAWSGIYTTFDMHSPPRTVSASTISNTSSICEAAHVTLVLPISRCHWDRTRRGCLVHTRSRSG